MKVILTGATGMVGEGVLFECLANPAVEQVLMVNRRSYPLEHAKLDELLVPDFMQLDGLDARLSGYDACLYCAGISSAGMKEAEYTHITYDLTMHFAEKLLALNPAMVFIFVSGGSTDSTEKGRMMWARVKGRTENALQRLGFKAVYCFRPGFMKATEGQRNVKWYYGLIGGLYPLLRVLTPNYVSTMQQVARAMIRTTQVEYPKAILEIKDINATAS